MRAIFWQAMPNRLKTPGNKTKQKKAEQNKKQIQVLCSQNIKFEI